MDLIYFCLSFSKGWGADPNYYFADSIVNLNGSYGGVFSIIPIVFISCLVVWVIIWLISHKNINEGISKVCKVLVSILFIIIIGIVSYSLTLNGGFNWIY